MHITPHVYSVHFGVFLFYFLKSFREFSTYCFIARGSSVVETSKSLYVKYPYVLSWKFRRKFTADITPFAFTEQQCALYTQPWLSSKFRKICIIAFAYTFSMDAKSSTGCLRLITSSRSAIKVLPRFVRFKYDAIVQYHYKWHAEISKSRTIYFLMSDNNG